MRKSLKIIFAAMLIFAMAMMSACGDKDQTNAGNDDKNKESYQVKLYYANEKYIAGEENEEELIGPVEMTLETDPKSAYLDTILTLKEVPEKTEGYTTMVLRDVKFNDVTLKDQVAYVDISSENLNGGSLQEILFIDQIVKTLKASFEEIHKVQFTVDGEIADSLMGHMDTSQPM